MSGSPGVATAVVFAYHEVGVRCLDVLLARGVHVPLVITHEDDPKETVWFGSVSELARRHGIETLTPDDPNAAELVSRVQSLGPDFLFSFYYRRMLSPRMLATARRGAFNMHGSLLPKFRGRVPVNWAVIKGATETGATLHEMVEKPDAGRIAGQEAVPIGPDDTAHEVFQRVVNASVRVLDRTLPALIDGTATLTAQDLKAGSYFGGRRPDDGRIDWSMSAADIHNLVRGVAPPYPGAFTFIDGRRVDVLKTRRLAGRMAWGEPPAIYVAGSPTGSVCIAVCADSTCLELLELRMDGRTLTAADFLATFGDRPLRPDS